MKPCPRSLLSATTSTWCRSRLSKRMASWSGRFTWLQLRMIWPWSRRTANGRRRVRIFSETCRWTIQRSAEHRSSATLWCFPTTTVSVQGFSSFFDEGPKRSFQVVACATVILPGAPLLRASFHTDTIEGHVHLIPMQNKVITGLSFVLSSLFPCLMLLSSPFEVRPS